MADCPSDETLAALLDGTLVWDEVAAVHQHIDGCAVVGRYLVIGLVIAVHEVGTIGERVFVAMEFVEGQMLDAWLLARRRSWREVLEVFREIGQGLAAAHTAGPVHRRFPLACRQSVR